MGCPPATLPPTCSGPLAPVPCKVCVYTVCGQCDKRLGLRGYNQCPMCRAPRPCQLPAVTMALHALRCTDEACERAQCAEAKVLLQWLEVHAQSCPDGQHGGPEVCKKCRVWRLLSTAAASPAACLPLMLQDETVNVQLDFPGPEAARARLRGSFRGKLA